MMASVKHLWVIYNVQLDQTYIFKSTERQAEKRLETTWEGSGQLYLMTPWQPETKAAKGEGRAKRGAAGMKKFASTHL